MIRQPLAGSLIRLACFSQTVLYSRRLKITVTNQTCIGLDPPTRDWQVRSLCRDKAQHHPAIFGDRDGNGIWIRLEIITRPTDRSPGHGDSVYHDDGRDRHDDGSFHRFRLQWSNDNHG